MLGTYSNIAYPMIALSKHTTKPLKEHLDCTFYICCYLLGTRYYSLVFDGSTKAGLIAYTNSNWASDLNTWHSQTVWFIKLAGCIFSWQSCQQSCVAYSSTEAEYIALSDCSKQVVWIHTIMEELGYFLEPIPICGDNQCVRKLARQWLPTCVMIFVLNIMYLFSRMTVITIYIIRTNWNPALSARMVRSRWDSQW